MGEEIRLTNDLTISIFERIHPTGYETQIDTARRVFDAVGISDAWTGPFMTGLAATGAEYFDARLIVPIARGVFHADLEQVRFRENQSEIILFVRLTAESHRRLTATFLGSSDTDAQLHAEFFRDDSATNLDPVWTQQQKVRHGDGFEVTVPASGPGLLALHLIPAKQPAPGAPLGVQLANLTLTQSP